MDQKVIVALLIPTLFGYWDEGRTDTFRIYKWYDVVRIEFKYELPEIFVDKEGRVTLCEWELDLHNPKFASLLKARVTRCMNGNCEKCKYYEE